MQNNPKTCSVCKQVKARTEFNKAPSAKDGLYSFCKPCHVKRNSANALARPKKEVTEDCTKACSQCKIVKPILSGYHLNKYCADGHQAACKSCQQTAACERYRSKNMPYSPRKNLLSVTGKVCIRCNERKDLIQFKQYKASPDPKYADKCFDCIRVPSGMNDVQWARMKTLIKGGRTAEPEMCECCEARPGDRRVGFAKSGQPKGLAYDHDHATDEFRGWLCAHCNRALGLMDDDPDMLLKLAQYVIRHNTQTASGTATPSLHVVSERVSETR